jgi:hypothetical protein
LEVPLPVAENAFAGAERAAADGVYRTEVVAAFDPAAADDEDE